MLFIGLIVIGLISYHGLGLDLLPDMSFPVSAVLVSYPGVAPEEIETLITIPLEEVLSTIQSLDSITSYSQESSSIILLSFQWGTNMDIATLEVREKIDQVKRILPEGASAPMVFKFDPTIMPVMMLAMNSERYDLNELQKFAQDLVKPQLERLEGIARATVSGGLEREILVSVDNEKLRANNLTLAQVIASLGSENINLPAGTLREGNIDLLVRTLGRFKNLEDIEKVVLSNMQGRQIYLTEVAQVIDTYKERDVIAYINGLPSISFNLQKESGSNTVLVANRVYQELEKIKDLLPHEVEITVAYDSSDFIKKAISQVVNVGLTGALLAVIVLFLFLRSLKSTLIISVAIPISIISTFILLYFSNLTLNMMTMGGLALGIGMLVDNAIVVLENIFRHHQLGEESSLAADYGANEVSNAITASTLTTIAVFLPVIYVSGIAGELFNTMGLTITFSLLLCLFVALTLIPMLSSRLMKNEHKVISSSEDSVRKNSFLSQSGSLFNFVKKEYSSLIKWSLRHRGIVVIGAIVIFMVSLSLIPIVGTEFMPSVDQGMFNINISLPVGTNLAVTEEVVRTVEGIVSEAPEVKDIFTIIGGGGMGMNQSTSSGGTIMVTLVDQRERERSTKEIIADLRAKVGEFPDTTINFGEQGVSLVTGSPLSIKITGDSLSELEYIADTVISLLSEIEGVYDLQSSLEEVLPEVHNDIDREKANLYGLTAGQIATTIQNALLGKVAGYYLEEGEQYDITVKLARGNVEQISELENLVISSAYGLQIPLKELAEVKMGVGPQTINREKQQRLVTVTGNVSGRVLGEVIQDAQQQLASLVLPEGYYYNFSGEFEQMTESFSDLFFALILSILLVFMIIAAQFESLLFPFAVIFSIPFALIGVIIALLLAGTSLNILVLLGFIMLAGIVVNNAIVLIDYINQLRRGGMERNEAVIEGGETRLRPILMTALTTILAMVPMALGIGEGAELRAPLAVAIIGGLTSSTFLTLIIIPIFYTYLDDLAKKLHLQF
jgi:HAE1 family hydrophobic/amphiphilic exporter-1